VRNGYAIYGKNGNEFYHAIFPRADDSD
jgi:hypothetical protein